MPLKKADLYTENRNNHNLEAHVHTYRPDKLKAKAGHLIGCSMEFGLTPWNTYSDYDNMLSPAGKSTIHGRIRTKATYDTFDRKKFPGINHFLILNTYF